MEALQLRKDLSRPVTRKAPDIIRTGLRMGAKPLVMFFPGRYDGQSLRLFDRLDDGNYYRAFKLVPDPS